MRNRLGDILIALIILILLTWLIDKQESDQSAAIAQQFATNYLWGDSLITTTVAIDCTFGTEWQQVVVSSDTIAMWYRAGSPDTTDWDSRDWLKLDEGDSRSYGPATKLRRFEWKADVGSGVIFFEGYKRVPQY